MAWMAPPPDRPIEIDPFSSMATDLVAWFPLVHNVNGLSYGKSQNINIPSNDSGIRIRPYAGHQAAEFTSAITDILEYPLPYVDRALGKGYSISCWTYSEAEAPANWGRVVCIADVGVGSEFFSFAFSDQTNTNVPTIRFYDFGTYYYVSNFSYNETALNEWVHWVAIWTFDGNLHLYRNGVLDMMDYIGFGSSVPTSGMGAFGASDVISIGNSPDLNDRDFTGGIQDVRFYNRELSQGEVNLLYGPDRWDLAKQPDPILAFVAGGATTYFQTNLGTLSTAGVITKETLKPFGGTVSSSGTVNKETAKSFAGTLSSSGILGTIKTALLSLAGTLGLSGILTKETAKTFEGTLSTSGILATVKTALLSLAGTLGLSGIVTKETSKTFEGTLSSSGILGTIKTALLSLAGTLGLSGILTKETNKGLSGSLSSAGTVIKETAKSLAGSVGLGGIVSKLTSKTFEGTLSTSGILAAVKTALLSLAGTLGLSGILTKETNKGLSGSLSTAGTVIKETAKSFAGSVGLGGIVSKLTSKTFEGTLSTGGVLAAVKTALLSLAGTLGLSGIVTKQTNKSLTGTLTTSGTISKLINKILIGTLTTAGVLVAVSDAAVFIFRSLSLRARQFLALRKRDGRKRE